jgi:hypothetical protein
MATAGILFFIAAFTKSFTDIVDWSTENWVWLCKWTKSTSTRLSWFCFISSCEISTCSFGWNCFLISSEACFKLMCFNPMSCISFGLCSLNSLK